MHEWDETTDLLAHSIIGYAVERLKTSKDPHWGARPASELDEILTPTITEAGIGGHEALRVFRDVLLPACRPMDDPMNLAYVPTAPTPAATMFDLVLSASSIFAGNWEAGAGAIAAENRTLRWLADLAGYPSTAGGVFVSGGSAANLSALVTARHTWRQRHGAEPSRLAIAATAEVHASARAAARVMDVEVLNVPADSRGRMTADALRAALDSERQVTPFAVIATGGTTNAGMVDDLLGISQITSERGLWLHVDGAYGLAALCAPSGRGHFAGIEHSDSFGVDPHKWLFTPYDCAALVYRDATLAVAAHAQHGEYLDAIDRDEWNPADYAYHLSRRARGLPLWFSLAAYGTTAYATAVEQTLTVARGVAESIERREGLTLLNPPQLSVVLFERPTWTFDDYQRWSKRMAKDGVTLIVPTRWQGRPCMRVCIVNPRTTVAGIDRVLDDLEHSTADR